MAGTETKNTETPPNPIWGFEPPASEPDTAKLDALLASLNSSAERFQTLWFSFLGLTLYLAIAALATTHRNLLLGEPQVLPILNIKVELLWFYRIVPLLYFVFHFYLLMMLVLLVRTAAEFEDELKKTLPDDAPQERYRARVENALFLQLLVGMKAERAGFNGFLLGLIALITVVLAPLATLILMQMMFLPYHHFGITWWHRIVVAADVVLIIVGWTLFFKYSGAITPLLPFRARPNLRFAARSIAGFAVIAFAFWLSFWEGRWAGEPVIGRPNIQDDEGSFATTRNGVVFGLFPDRLQLTSETIVGEQKLEETKKEISSRGGDVVPTIKLDDRDLQGANLNGADLRVVSLKGAEMQGANLSSARLDGAQLARADLRGAELADAQFPGADLADAQLQGVDLVYAKLPGAMLNRAQLQGAFLGGSELQGADLSRAQLRGANLGQAQLQGANLWQTQLQGTSLWRAQLQGADFSGADLTDSAFNETFVFLTYISDANLATAVVRSVHSDPVKLTATGEVVPLNRTDDVDGWIAAATQFVSEKRKHIIVEQFARLKTDSRESVEDATWSGIQEASLTLDLDAAQHRQRLRKFLGDLACKSAGAPYVSRGLIDNRRLKALGDQLDEVRRRLRAARDKPDACKGVAGFTEDDWRALEAIEPAEAAPADH